jgi:hypothetical protein
MNDGDREILMQVIKSNKELIEQNTERIKVSEDHFLTLNREMGQVQGQLVWIKWLLCAVLGVIIAGYIIL